jgi:hypothetical protein
MNEISEEPYRNKSHATHGELVIDEIIQSLEKVDKKIERFYEIHGTELNSIGKEQTGSSRS